MLSLTRVRPASSLLVAALALAIALAAAVPAAAVTRKQATSKALAALGSSQAEGPLVVFGLPGPLRAGARVTQGRAKRLVLARGRERALFFYEDAAPGRPYPHPGRVALVGLASGKVRVSRTIMRAPRINGRLPAFLRSRAAYGSPRYRVLQLSGSAPKASAPPTVASPPAALQEGDPFEPFEGENTPPTAFGQELIVKQGVPKRVTLTATDRDADPLTFHVLERPRRGKLTGQPPDLVYTPGRDYLGPDQIVFVARDDDKDSEPARISLQVVPQGEPPTIAASPGCTEYLEQGPGVPIDRELTVFDPDDRELDRATVRIAEGFQHGDDLLFDDQHGISSSYDAEAGILRLVGTAPVEAYLEALRSVRYRNEASANPAKSKGILFTVNDAGLDSQPAFKPLCIVSSNDPPVGETGEGVLVYAENDGPVPVDASFVVGDPDSTHLSRATIEFIPHVSQPVDHNGDPVGPPIVTDTFSPAEDELMFTDQNGITGFYDDVAGVLELSGLATLAQYEAAIRSVTYENSSEDPSEAVRRLQFQLTDSSRASSATVRRDAYITAINDPPLLWLSKGWTFYLGRATLIDPELTVADVDDEIQSAVVRIADGFVPGDVLEYVDEHGIGGDYDKESGTLTLKGTAPAEVYEAALRSVAYVHPDGEPKGSRTVEFVTYDGELESSVATKLVVVDGRPILRASEKALLYWPGDGWVPLDDAITVTDPDSEILVGATVTIERGFSESEDELMFEDRNGISGAYDDGMGVLTLKGEAPVADYEAALRSVLFESWSKEGSARTVTFQVVDERENLSDPVGREIEITPP